MVGREGLSEDSLLSVKLLPKVRGPGDVSTLGVASRASLVLLSAPQPLRPMVLPLHLSPAYVQVPSCITHCMVTSAVCPPWEPQSVLMGEGEEAPCSIVVRIKGDDLA